MRFPGKLASYQESDLSKFPIILRALEKNDMPVSDLYHAVGSRIGAANDFLRILDCLYALGKLDYDTSEGTLRYVG